MTERDTTRRRRFGAEVVAQRGVHFTVHAPSAGNVEVVTDRGVFPMQRQSNGDWTVLVPGVGPGCRYQYRLQGDDKLYPDPASRFQPEGPHLPSEVIDPTFAWTDSSFTPPHSPVIYEMHIGTFTQEGTWDAARSRLAALRELGVDMLELMPVSEFAGRWGWGYDGVQWFAPFHGYGRPEDMKRFINEAHAQGLAVILDVVYNHFGPDGNYVGVLAPDHASTEMTEWGARLNFDGPGSDFMRSFVVENAAYWIDEFHLDGLRLDATQAITDGSRKHVVAELTEAARAVARKQGKGKAVYVVGENEPQHTIFVRPPEKGGYGIDALWNDDFHHSAVVAATGHREAYYQDYEGNARELLACVKHGYLFQGQLYAWQEKRRGSSTRRLPPRSMVAFLENHDQVANYGRGLRLWQRAQSGDARALTGLLCLAPWSPMLFQGQEWNAATPFHYFADHQPQLATAVAQGRGEFMAQFPRYKHADARALLSNPVDESTFKACVLDWTQRQGPHEQAALALHRDLLRLRREDPTLRAAREPADLDASGKEGPRAGFDGAVITEKMFLLRFWGEAEDGSGDRLLWVNLGADHSAPCLSEPLYAPPEGLSWHLAWSSENPRYGGQGTRVAAEEEGLFVAGHATELFVARKEQTK